MPLTCDSSPENLPEVEALFSGGTPEDRRTAVSDLCSYGLAPPVVHGILHQLLRQHFCDPIHMLNPRLRERLREYGPWRITANTSDGRPTGLRILSDYDWESAGADAQLAIVVSPGDWKFARVQPHDVLASNDQTGVLEFCGLWNGSHTIFALANIPADALSLGTEVTKLLLHAGYAIGAGFGFSAFQMQEQSRPQRRKPYGDHWSVATTISYTVTERWETRPEAPYLQHISLTTETATATVDDYRQ